MQSSKTDANIELGQTAGKEESQAMTVSAALAFAKRALEAVTVTIVGEVSEVSVKAGYKAAYFTVKDSSFRKCSASS